MGLLDSWPSSVARNTSPEYLDPLAIDLQPPSDAASSTTTSSTVVTTDTALTSAAENSSTTQTTPDIDIPEVSDYGSKEQTGSGDSKEMVDSAPEEGSSATRRRSLRIKATTVAASPITPSTRSKQENALPTTAPTTTDSASTETKKHNLRSTEKKAGTHDAPPPARRVSTRVSALNAIAKMTSTPTNQTTKRSHEIMAAGSKSADAKLGGGYNKKVKVEKESPGKFDLSTIAPASGGAAAPHRKIRKVWLNQGLYVGTESEQDAMMKPGSAKKKATKGGRRRRTNTLPQPMFLGSRIIETERDFKLPYFIFAPSQFKCGPIHDWRRLNHNVFIGDALMYWKKEKSSNIKCVCTTECNEHCLNRCTWMECDDGSCNVGRDCKNRAFADLKERVKSGTKFAEGVEVFLTEDRGYGLRATRSFEPRQIIVEYTGEIITQEESERRMKEVYKDKKNYYLMLFDQNMILDATRGSVARFVNHSCEPNCRMEKWLVEGKPRMALFAGDEGVEAGDELTYDYNFNWFKGVTQQSCKCGSEKCRGTLGKRTDVPKKLTTTPATKSKGKIKGKSKGYKGTVKTELGTTKPKVLGPRHTVKGRIQQSVILSPKKTGRKPPARRQTEPAPQAPPRDPTPDIYTFEASEESTPETEEQPLNTTPTQNHIARPRITRTYKVNKTIAKPSVLKTITSKSSIANTKKQVLEKALLEATQAANATATSSTGSVVTPSKNAPTRTTRRRSALLKEAEGATIPVFA